MLTKQQFFPSQSRYFPGQRWINILLRTLHLIGIAGLGGGFLYSKVVPGWEPFWDLTIWSGLGLVVISIWNNGIWLIQLRGQAVLFKVLLLAMIPLWPAMKLPFFVAVIAISGLISHAPARVRYYSLYHRRQIGSD